MKCIKEIKFKVRHSKSTNKLANIFLPQKHENFIKIMRYGKSWSIKSFFKMSNFHTTICLVYLGHRFEVYGRSPIGTLYICFVLLPLFCHSVQICQYRYAYFCYGTDRYGTDIFKGFSDLLIIRS